MRRLIDDLVSEVVWHATHGAVSCSSPIRWSWQAYQRAPSRWPNRAAAVEHPNDRCRAQGLTPYRAGYRCLHRKCQEAVMDKIEIPADETVPLDSIATGTVGLRILFVNVFAVAGENPTRR
jgi:hypothetical protein